MAGAALDSKEGAEQNVNAAQLHLSPGRSNSSWWRRVNISPGLPETEQFPGLPDFHLTPAHSLANVDGWSSCVRNFP